MRQKRILLTVVVLACSLGLALTGCDNNALPDWEDPWPVDAEAPTLSAATPDSGKAGESISVAGTNLNATAANNFVLVGAGSGQYLCDVTAATASQLTITLPAAAANMPFNTWVIIDTVMGQFGAYPDSEIAEIDSSEIDTVIDSDTTWVYDTTWTVYEEPDTVTVELSLTSPFQVKAACRGSMLWSNTISMKVMPSDTMVWRWLYPDNIYIMEPDTLIGTAAPPSGWTIITE